MRLLSADGTPLPEEVVQASPFLQGMLEDVHEPGDVVVDRVNHKDAQLLCMFMSDQYAQTHMEPERVVQLIPVADYLGADKALCILLSQVGSILMKDRSNSLDPLFDRIRQLPQNIRLKMMEVWERGDPEMRARQLRHILPSMPWPEVHTLDEMKRENDWILRFDLQCSNDACPPVFKIEGSWQDYTDRVWEDEEPPRYVRCYLPFQAYAIRITVSWPSTSVSPPPHPWRVFNSFCLSTCSQHIQHMFARDVEDLQCMLGWLPPPKVDPSRKEVTLVLPCMAGGGVNKPYPTPDISLRITLAPGMSFRKMEVNCPESGVQHRNTIPYSILEKNKGWQACATMDDAPYFVCGMLWLRFYDDPTFETLEFHLPGDDRTMYRCSPESNRVLQEAAFGSYSPYLVPIPLFLMGMHHMWWILDQYPNLEKTIRIVGAVADPRSYTLRAYNLNILRWCSWWTGLMFA